MQKDRLRLTNPEAARTLLDSPVLGRFVDEQNSSDIAKELKMPANLVHHHVKRGVELGLLEETRREGKRIYYQLVAKEFTHSKNLLEYQEQMTSALTLLSSAFLPAYEASEAQCAEANDPDYHTIGFVEPATLPPKPKRLEENVVQTYPAHFQSRTVRLTSVQYKRFLSEMNRIINDINPQLSGDVKPCTLTLIGFQGELRAGHNNAEDIKSFLEPQQDLLQL
jgi:DNA-binding MarR family transcriptional regulator